LATTTYEAIRDEQLALIQALTPDSFAGEPFLEALDEIDFRVWADEHPDCMRRFTIGPLEEEIPPVVSNQDVEESDGEQTVLVAYPNDHRYGSDNSRDRADVMRQDEVKIRKEIGPIGRGNYSVDVATPWLRTEYEEMDAVVIMAISFRVLYRRSI
jgi:hypothetical protein